MQKISIAVAIEYEDAPIVDGKPSQPIVFTDTFVEPDLEDFGKITDAIYRAGTIRLIKPTSDLLKKIGTFKMVERDRSTTLSCAVWVKSGTTEADWLDRVGIEHTADYDQYAKAVIGVYDRAKAVV